MSCVTSFMKNAHVKMNKRKVVLKELKALNAKEAML